MTIRQTKRNRMLILLTVILAVALAVVFSTEPVHAASKKTVYLVDKVTTKATGRTGSEVLKLSYNSKGDGVRAVLRMRTATSRYRGTITSKFSRGLRMKDVGKFVQVENGKEKDPWRWSFTETYRYKNGRCVYQKCPVGNAPRKFYYDSRGRLTKAYCYSGKEKKSLLIWVAKFHYGSGSRVSKIVYQQYEFGKATSVVTDTYHYDSHGNVKKMVSRGSNMDTLTTTYRNTYRNGRLVKMKIKPSYTDSADIYTFHYKKCRIPASRVSRVKRDQRMSFREPYRSIYLTLWNFYGMNIF